MLSDNIYRVLNDKLLSGANTGLTDFALRTFSFLSTPTLVALFFAPDRTVAKKTIAFSAISSSILFGYESIKDIFFYQSTNSTHTETHEHNETIGMCCSDIEAY